MERERSSYGNRIGSAESGVKAFFGVFRGAFIVPGGVLVYLRGVWDTYREKITSSVTTLLRPK